MSTTSSETSVDAEAFREAMGNICTPVAVVTTCDRAGQPYGTTVSAFCSLLLDPPMILVALDRSSGFLAAVRKSGVLGVNVLLIDAEHAGRHFAKKGGGDFLALTGVGMSACPRLGAIPFLRARPSVISMGATTRSSPRGSTPSS